MGIHDTLLGLPVRAAASLASTRGRARRLLILNYHRVLPAADEFHYESIDADIFDAQMGIVARQFRPLPLAEAVERVRDDSLPARAVSITFDDGYADNCDVALPILERHGVPATFFVTTGVLDGGRMWNDTIVEAVRRAPGDRLSLEGAGLKDLPIDTIAARRDTALKVVLHLRRMADEERRRHTEDLAAQVGAELPDDLMLSSDQLRKLYQSGMEIGGHTVSHPILSRLDADDAVREISEGKARLEEITGASVSGFAYPNGQPGVDYDDGHVAAVANSGFDYAVSTARGACTSASDPYQLPRFGPWGSSPLKFGLRLAQEFLSPPAAVA